MSQVTVTIITVISPFCNFARPCTIRTVGEVSPDCLKPRGLREAKKAQTRSALADAALHHVAREGYEATTVEAIARTAGVSVRTFHNYFPGKAAVLGHLSTDLIIEFHELLHAQPDNLSCADALRDAWIGMMDRHREDIAELSALVDAIETNPDLRRHLRESHPEVGARNVDEIARRLGVDPAVSVVPHVIVEISFTLAVTVIRMQATAEFSGRTNRDLLREAFTALPMLVANPTDPAVATAAADPTADPLHTD